MTVLLQTAARPEHRLGKFFPQVHALRAIAVLMVLVYHLWPNRFPGGFIGVDVFFVISGYLITAHLWRSRAEGWRALPRFWGRRIVRLGPAAITTILLSGLVVFLSVPQFYWSRYAREALASLGIGENIVLMNDSVDYLAGDNSPTPFQHYWSLSVEEQFYIAWPILLILLVGLIAARFPRLDASRIATVCVGAVFVASFAFSVSAVAAHSPDAYFSMPLRMWEFCLGAILALTHERLINLPGANTLRNATATPVIMVLLYAALGACGLFYTGATPFPGWAALLPVALTALIIMLRPMAVSGDAPLRFLEQNRIVRFAADTSYAAYLTHWPLIILVPFLIRGDLTTPAKLGILVASFALAFLITRYVESPLRSRALARGLRGPLITVLAGAIVVALGWAAIWHTGSQNTPAEGQTYSQAELSNPCFAARALQNPKSCSPVEGTVSGPGPLAAGQKDRPDPWKKKCVAAVGGNAKPVCEYPFGGQGAPTVVLWGDSHAGAWSPAVEEVAKAGKANLFTFTRDGCPASLVSPTATVFREIAADEQVHCRERNAQVEDFIRKQSGPVLVVLTSLSTNYSYPAESPYGGLDRLIGDLNGAGARVVLLGDVPLTGDNQGNRVNVGECLIKRYPDLSACNNSRARALDYNGQREFLRDRLSHSQFTLVDPSTNFCDSSTCYAIVGGVPVYFDASHLTDTYSRSIGPWLSNQLQPILRDLTAGSSPGANAAIG